MKPSDKKKLARTILSEMAVTMLMDDQTMKSAVQAALRKRYTDLVNRSEEVAVKQILVIKNIVTKLTEKLMDCQDSEMIAQVALVIDGINTAKVYIAPEEQELIHE